MPAGQTTTVDTADASGKKDLCAMQEKKNAVCRDKEEKSHCLMKGCDLSENCRWLSAIIKRIIFPLSLWFSIQ